MKKLPGRIRLNAKVLLFFLFREEEELAWQRPNTHGQVLQLQLTDSVVGFDVLGDEGELEAGLLEDAVPLLPLRPVLGAFDLRVQPERDKVGPGAYPGRRLRSTGSRCSRILSR